MLIDLLKNVAASPALALLGAGVLLALLLAPIALRVAGLSGSQIVDLLKTTARFAFNLASALRIQDEGDKDA